MKVVVCGAIDGDMDVLNKIHDDTNCDVILLTGNIGLHYRSDKQRKQDETFYKYLASQKQLSCQVIGVVGSKENYQIANLLWNENLQIPNFKLLKNGEKFTYSVNGDGIGVTGLGGGYSSKLFNVPNEEKNIKLSGNRYFNYEDVQKVNQSYETNILLAHELIGPYSGKNIVFTPEQLEVLYSTFAIYCFVGRYRKFFHSPFPRTFRPIEIVSLPEVSDGYAILDTKDWSLAAVGNIVKECDGGYK
jgi:hypothetical protein